MELFAVLLQFIKYYRFVVLLRPEKKISLYMECFIIPWAWKLCISTILFGPTVAISIFIIIINENWITITFYLWSWIKKKAKMFTMDWINAFVSRNKKVIAYWVLFACRYLPITIYSKENNNNKIKKIGSIELNTVIELKQKHKYREFYSLHYISGHCKQQQKLISLCLWNVNFWYTNPCFNELLCSFCWQAQ